MRIKLLFHALLKLIVGLLITVLLIFLPAGSLYFFNGWLLIFTLIIPMVLTGIFLMIFSPDLLKKRLNMQETQKEQSLVIKLSAAMFVFGFIVAGLDFRFGWSCISGKTSIIATILFLISYIMYTEVMRENKYLSRNIEIQVDQKVIDTGLYGIIRHPMYFSTIIMFLSIPIILGSLWSFIIFLPSPAIIAYRINNEEDFLLKNLNGYKEYTQKVKYRLIPFIW